jgi:antitoxin (DNA-binding transcriptional repressor) of toxin-antitoxin stability system
VITQRGEAVARLIPERAGEAKKVNWSESPAIKRDRTCEKVLTAQESLDLIHDAASKW